MDFPQVASADDEENKVQNPNTDANIFDELDPVLDLQE